MGVTDVDLLARDKAVVGAQLGTSIDGEGVNDVFDSYVVVAVNEESIFSPRLLILCFKLSLSFYLFVLGRNRERKGATFNEQMKASRIGKHARKSESMREHYFRGEVQNEDRKTYKWAVMSRHGYAVSSTSIACTACIGNASIKKTLF